MNLISWPFSLSSYFAGPGAEGLNRLRGRVFSTHFFTKKLVTQISNCGAEAQRGMKSSIDLNRRDIELFRQFSSNDVVWRQENNIHLKKPQKFAFGRLQLRENISKTTKRNYIVHSVLEFFFMKKKVQVNFLATWPHMIVLNI